MNGVGEIVKMVLFYKLLYWGKEKKKKESSMALYRILILFSGDLQPLEIWTYLNVAHSLVHSKS